MKVYVVEYGYWDENWIDAIWATQAEADADAEEMNENGLMPGSYTVTEWEVL
jgi:hypothetical protein